MEDLINKVRFGNYSYLKNIWEKHIMITFKDFLRCYNNKNVIHTLEALQKNIDFYHDKGIDMLKLGCTLPNLANICLQITNFTRSLKEMRIYERKLENT